ncbi:WYL domain-containing protein [Actinotalea sp. AC32]|nr:WYL domain-containing protein [Actinotalea sp. AC32]
MPAQTPAAERLLNLVIALVNTTGRMTKEQIRASVAGYDPEAATDAFERMFERDKETLRQLGVPVVTVTSAAHGDDLGYRIDTDAYALPPMDLSAAQLGVLSLAAAFWTDQTLQADASRALTKLRAVGATPSETDAIAGLAPRVHAAGPALAPLLDAAHDRQVVAFTYRTASTGEVRRRHVEPWRLVASRGGWYLVGRDRDRDAPRVFRLNRIEGPVVPQGPSGAFTVPPDADPAALISSAQRADARTAWLAVAPDRAGALRARAVRDAAPPPGLRVPPGTDLVAVPYQRASDLAAEITGYTDAVVVLDPPELRAAVVDRLRAAVAMGGRVAPEAGRG